MSDFDLDEEMKKEPDDRAPGTFDALLQGAINFGLSEETGLPTTLVIDDPEECGLYQKERCCAFLSGTPAQWLCGRTMPGIYLTIRMRLLEGKMNAKYDPGQTPYPQCQPGKAP